MAEDLLNLISKISPDETPLAVSILMGNGMTPDEAWAKYKRMEKGYVNDIPDDVAGVVVEEEMTVKELFERETREISSYLDCNTEELVHEMNLLFDKCIKLMWKANPI